MKPLNGTVEFQAELAQYAASHAMGGGETAAEAIIAMLAFLQHALPGSAARYHINLDVQQVVPPARNLPRFFASVRVERK